MTWSFLVLKPTLPVPKGCPCPTQRDGGAEQHGSSVCRSLRFPEDTVSAARVESIVGDLEVAIKTRFPEIRHLFLATKGD